MAKNNKPFLALIVLGAIVGMIVLQIKEEFATMDPKLGEIKEVLKQLDPRASQLTLYEGDKSYTVNKEKMTLCIKVPGTEQYYDDNTLRYVAIHELAHATNQQDIGHTPAFYKEFDRLLDIASQKGLYDPSKPIPDNYCNYKKGGGH
jgi:hypothetical protein